MESNTNMKKVFVILGPTATGKSDLAVKLATRLRQGFGGQEKIEAEIISADSRQVYTGLDIGTGKITKKEMKGIPHHLLSVVNPKKVFTVVKYKEQAEEKIREIISRNKTPIICGGTGFYIDAVTKGIIFPDVPPNKKLRKTLERKSLISLLKILTKLDAKRSKNIDVQNKVRLIRAIEIAKSLGEVPKITEATPPYKFIKIGLYLPEEKLRKNISTRLDKRMKKGMLKEVKNLHRHGMSYKRMRSLGLEYRAMALYLQKKLSRPEMVEMLNREIYQYAKRQMTWFKKDRDIQWFDASKSKKLSF